MPNPDGSPTQAEQINELAGGQGAGIPATIPTTQGDLTQAEMIDGLLGEFGVDNLKIRRQTQQQERNLFQQVSTPLVAARNDILNSLQEPIGPVAPGTRVTATGGRDRDAIIDGFIGAFQGVADALPFIGLASRLVGSVPPVKSAPAPTAPLSGFAKSPLIGFAGRIAEVVVLAAPAIAAGPVGIGFLSAVQVGADLYGSEIASGLRQGLDDGEALMRARERVLEPAGIGQIALSGLLGGVTFKLAQGFELARVAAVTGGVAAGRAGIAAIGKNLAIDIPGAVVETVANAFAEGRGFDVDLAKDAGFTSLVVSAASVVLGLPTLRGGKVVPRPADAPKSSIVPDAEATKFSRGFSRRLNEEVDRVDAGVARAREVEAQEAQVGQTGEIEAPTAKPTERAPVIRGDGGPDEAPSIKVKSDEPAVPEQPAVREPAPPPETSPAVEEFAARNPDLFAGEIPASPATIKQISDIAQKLTPVRRAATLAKTKELGIRAKAATEAFDAEGGRAGLIASKSALSGQIIPDIEPIGKFFTSDQIDELLNHPVGHPALLGRNGQRDIFKELDVQNTIEGLLVGKLPQPKQLRTLKKVFGEEFTSGIEKNIPKTGKILRTIGEIINTPRTLLSSFDISNTTRQSLSLILGNPVLGLRAFKRQLQAVGSEEVAQRIDDALRAPRLIQAPNGDTIDLTELKKLGGLELPTTRLGEDEIGFRSEAYMSQYIQRFAARELQPGLKNIVARPAQFVAKGVRASERGFLTMGNLTRSNIADSVLTDAIQNGSLDVDKDFAAVKELMTFLNVGSGRGTTKGGLLQGPWWNFLLFSPRFVTSRFEYWGRLAHAIRPTAHSVVRKQALQQLVGTAVAWGGLAAFAKVASDTLGNDDIEVVLDPRDPRFLKFAINDNTTIDIGGGYGQAIRFTTQMLTGDRRDPETSRIEALQRGRTMLNFGRSKLAPVPGATVDVAVGKDFTGQVVSPLGVLARLTTPISIQTLDEVIREHDIAGAALIIPEVLGSGVSVFEKRSRRGRGR